MKAETPTPPEKYPLTVMRPTHHATSVDRPVAAAFGQLLYERRLAACMTQANVAAAAGLSVSYVRNLENSRRLPPPRRTAVRLAKVLALERKAANAFVAATITERSSERPDGQ